MSRKGNRKIRPFAKNEPLDDIGELSNFGLGLD